MNAFAPQQFYPHHHVGFSLPSLFQRKTVFALDVSSAQLVADYSAVKAAGISGVWAKATDGVGSPDSRFLGHALSARAAGLPVGAYHYLRVRQGGWQNQDAIKQADEFCDRYIQGRCNLPPMVDVESEGQPSVDSLSWYVAVLSCCNRIEERLGRPCIVYTSKGEWESFGLNQYGVFKKFPLWLANTGGVTNPPVPAPWTSPSLWQWSWQGQVPGFGGTHVDVSAFYGTESQFDVWAGRIPLVGKIALGLGAALLYLFYR